MLSLVALVSFASTREQGGTGNKSNGFLQPSLKRKKLWRVCGDPLPVLPVLVTLRVVATPSPYCRPSPLATLAGVLVPVPTDRLLQVAAVR